MGGGESRILLLLWDYGHEIMHHNTYIHLGTRAWLAGLELAMSIGIRLNYGVHIVWRCILDTWQRFGIMHQLGRQYQEQITRRINLTYALYLYAVHI